MNAQLRIYQISPQGEGCKLLFHSLAGFRQAGYTFPPRRFYEQVYEGPLLSLDPEMIFAQFNINQPKDYHSRSLSVSDVVEFVYKTHSEFYFCNLVGFDRIPFK